MTHFYHYRIIKLLAISVLVSLLLPTSNGAESTEPARSQIERAAAAHLSGELLRVARLATQVNPLDVESIEVGVALIETAAEIDPDNPDVWRAWIEMSIIADDPIMRRLGVKELLRLFPHETPLQLARLRDAVDTLNTASERELLYEKLLSNDGETKLDAGVASRLAFDAAMLQRQLGNTQQFARWLAESVSLDPYFTDATAVAVGFFGDDSADAYRRVELLTSLMLANMRDVTTQVSLAELLMSFGAYKSASRVYDIALADNAGNPSAIPNDLISDIVMAHWAAREIDEAFEIISKRQRESDERFRNNIRAQESRATPLDLARVHAPLSPKLATVVAAMYEGREKKESELALRSALDSFASLLLTLENRTDVPSLRVTLKDISLQAAWLSVWLGDLVEESNSFLLKAATYSTVTEKEKNHINGWIALRNNDLVGAENSFNLVGHGNDSATAGLASVFLLRNNEQDAARLFLKLARESAGTLIGIWSRNQLEKILGQKIVARAESVDLDTLIEAIPKSVDHYPVDPTTTFTVRAKPVAENVGPYEPVLVEIELSNNGLLPMQIAQHGPIQPLILLNVEPQVVHERISSTIPIIVPIDRKLILKPREKFTITVDLRKYWVGSLFNMRPMTGGFLGFYAVSNFKVGKAPNRRGVEELVYTPSALGSKSQENRVRIEGLRLTNIWLEGAIAQSNEMDTPDDLVSFVLLTWAAGDGVHVQVVEPLITPRAGEEVFQIPEGERHPLQDEATTTILLKFPSLDIISKAWVLSAMSTDPMFESLIVMADSDGEDLPTIGWMLRFVTPGVDDTTLDNVRLIEAMEDESPRVQLIAKWVYKWVELKVTQRRERAIGTFDEESSLQ